MIGNYKNGQNLVATNFQIYRAEYIDDRKLKEGSKSGITNFQIYRAEKK